MKLLITLLLLIFVQTVMAQSLTTTNGNIYTGSTSTPMIFNIGTAANPKVYITTAGNLGIGYSAPSEKLQVAGNIKSSGSFIADNGIFSTLTSTAMSFVQGSSTAMSISTSSKLGIGTTSPTQKAQITVYSPNTTFPAGASDPQLGLQNVSSSTGNFEGISFMNSASATVAQVGAINAEQTSVGAGELYFATKANPGSLTQRLLISHDGNVGIGLGNGVLGQDKLHVGGNVILDAGGSPSIYTGTGSTELARYLQITNAKGLVTPAGLKAGGILVSDNFTYASPGKNDLIVSGKVGIGTPLATNPNAYILAVNGKIGCKDLQIETTSWPDYVFSDTYKLRPLYEVERFIQENHHLENVPTEAEVKQNGFSTAQMNEVYLSKIEELTLYIISLKKEIDQLKTEIKSTQK